MIGKYIRGRQTRIRSNIGGVLFGLCYAPLPSFAMKIRNIFAAVAAFVSINFVIAQWQPNVQCDNRTLPEIYAAAQKEHKTTADAPLQVLMGGDAGSQGDAYRQAWRELFPDLPLNLTIDLSKYQSINIDLAYYGNRHVADVVGLQTVQDFGRWKAENRLLYYKPINFEDLISGEKDLDGAYVPNSVCKSRYLLRTCCFI